MQPDRTRLLQCYKAVPALCLHMMKKVPAKGPGRLHILRVLEAIVGKSMSKYGTNDKFGARVHLQPPHCSECQNVPSAGLSERLSAALSCLHRECAMSSSASLPLISETNCMPSQVWFAFPEPASLPNCL